MPHVHGVYHHICELYAALGARVDIKSLGPSTEGWLEHNNAADQNVHQQRQRIGTNFSDVVRTAKDEYVKNHMDFAKQVRIVDPRQLAGISPEISDVPTISPSSIHDQIVNSGEWESIEAYSCLTFCSGGKP